MIVLDAIQLTELFDRLGTPRSGQDLVIKAREQAPVRDVQSRGGNVLTEYQSRKMARTIKTESRHLEFPAVIGHEFDREVLEYYAQPCVLKFDFIDEDGEVHSVEHTPDVLVISKSGIWLEEWKPWEKLAKRAQKSSWRYAVEDDHWVSRPIEEWLAERGIGYRICTEHDIPQRRVENFLLLEDYLDPECPGCPQKVSQVIFEMLAVEPALTLSDLYSRADCGADEVFPLIANKALVCDLDTLPLSEPNRFRVYRDTAVQAFEQASTARQKLQIAGIVELEPNSTLLYEGNRHTVKFVGSRSVTLTSELGSTFEIDIASVTDLVQRGSISMANGDLTVDPLAGLADLTEKQIAIAQKRHALLMNGGAPSRTERRWRAKVRLAGLYGVNEILALAPNIKERGNREPRLAPAQEQAIQNIVNKYYLTPSAPNIRHCHKRLLVACAELGIQPVSYTTLRKHIKDIEQKLADSSRFGKRLAYSRGDFVQVLFADTPIHGSRAFQYVHVDHTVLDLELRSTKTDVSLGRPTLTFAVDAYTRRVLGLYLSFDPPSTRAVMMVMRDMVKRHKRLPQFLVVDNGADFRSDDFKLLCQMLTISIRRRPAGNSRGGAVMERVFGTVNTQYVHNLAGNTKATKYVRQITKKFLPSKLAEWSLDLIYRGIEHWAFEYYDNEPHGTLGISPREAFDRSLIATGVRAHRIVTYSRDFKILTCPSVERQFRQIDRQRGIKLHSNFWFWCEEMRHPTMQGRRVHVRFDPWDASTVFVHIDQRWVPARCKALSGIESMTEDERRLYAEEMRASQLVKKDESVTAQRLSEFISTFTPKDLTQKILEKQAANRELYAQLDHGAVVPSTTTSPRLAQDDQRLRVRTNAESVTETENLKSVAPEQPKPPSDIKNLPTFKRF